MNVKISDASCSIKHYQSRTLAFSAWKAGVGEAPLPPYGLAFAPPADSAPRFQEHQHAETTSLYTSSLPLLRQEQKGLCCC